MATLPIAGAIGSAAIGTAGSVLNGQNSDSSSWGTGFSNSAYGNTSSSEAISRLYGSAASAEDILRANEANELQNAYLEKQMAYNSREAEINRNFQQYMSNTSYQRAIADLKAAGLNPILAAMNMGATTPSGSYASSGLQTAYKANTYADQESYSSGSASGWGNSHGEDEYGSDSTTRTQIASMLDGLGTLLSGTGSILNTTSASSANKKLTGNKVKNVRPGSQLGMAMSKRKQSSDLQKLTAVPKSIHK